MTHGVLGGVFDPAHNGHVALARGAIAHFGLQHLVVLVAASPGHKGVVLDAANRFRLAQVAFGGLPGAEIVLDDHPFTVDAVAGGRYRDSWFIVGADELAGFLTWKEPERVLDEVRLAVGTRPGYSRERLDTVIADLSRPGRVEVFELDEPMDISSTDVRARAARGEAIDGLVPPDVARVIREEGLYRRQAGVH
jgi:nicotinate-nucleotide adenylyltransferase